MFFTLSKVFWFFADPGNFLLIVLAAGVVLTGIRRWARAGRRLVALSLLLGLSAAVLPIGPWLLLPLENRFPAVRSLPDRVHGIIVLGGVVDQLVTRARGQVALGGAVERLVESVRLANRYPRAKYLFTSGSGLLLDQDVKEADVIAPILDRLGLETGRALFENRSRNTFENAVFSKRLVKPEKGETWILVTSAFHMPRAVGVFRQAGWPVTPYPVDYSLRGDEGGRFSFNLIGGLSRISTGVHEWLGLVFYRVTGKTAELFPGPVS